MKKRVTPKKMALKIAKLIGEQNPDYNYVKKIFEHVRLELNLKGTAKSKKKLPELLSKEEIQNFYEAVWKGSKGPHMILVKLLLFTGIRNAELANIKLSDVELDDFKVRINSGKGGKDRYVLFPKSFRDELTQYYLSQKEKGCEYLFESNRKTKYSTRWIRAILKDYAVKAGIKKRVYPHLFRHQLLTYLTQSGIVDAKIQLLSGHSNRESLAVYQDLSLKDIESEYQKVMEDYLL